MTRVKEFLSKFSGAVSLAPKECLITDENYEVHSSVDIDDPTRVHVVLQLRGNVLTQLVADPMLIEKIKSDLKKSARESGVDWDRCEITESSPKPYLTEFFLTPR